jgi:hypothetical protein
MSLLTLNGIVIPVAAEGVRVVDDSLKTSTRMIDGEYRRDIRAYKRRIIGQTRLMPLDEARAVWELLRGRGHTWPFDETLSNGGQYSSKGLAVTGDFGLTTGGKFGRFLEASGIGDAQVAGLSAYSAAWTTAQWIFTGSVWEHRLHTSAGLKYTNGSPTPSASWSYPITSGTYTILNGTEIDDLVILPYPLPAALCAQWPQTTPFGLLPALSAAGDLIPEASLLVEGTGEPELQLTQGSWGGVWQALASVPLDLVEV